MRKAIRRRLAGENSKKQQTSAREQALTCRPRALSGDLAVQFPQQDELPQATLEPEQADTATLDIINCQDVDMKQSIWALAYQRLQEMKPDLLAAFESAVEDETITSSDPRERLAVGVAKKRQAMLSKQWTIKFMNNRIKVRDQVQRVIRVFQYAHDFGGVIANIDPVHAGLPWAGVNVLFNLLLNNSKQNDNALYGLEEISGMISRYMVVEKIYSERKLLPLKPEYQENLTNLYTKILEFQATATCHFHRDTVVRVVRSTLQLEDWSKLLEDVRAKDAACKELVVVFDSMDQRIGTRLLQETLEQQDLILQQILQKLRSDQAHNKSISRWLSTIPYKADHDQVRRNLGARYHDSGRWLLAFIDGQNDIEESSIMWLCGTIGTGKSCAVSVVVQHLTPPINNEPSRRLLYFYISQKQARRNEPIDIFRCLVAQLAWATDGMSIAGPLKTIYDERGEGIAGGGELCLEECLDLLIELSCAWSEVIIILDALDECSDPSTVLAGLTEIYSKSESTVKLFLSSRMDVDVPCHFPNCHKIQIDAGKSSYDVEIFIRGEVNGQKRRLLDGKRPDLEDRLIGILTARAQGMFIWVKLQLVTFFSPKLRLRLSRDVESKLDAFEKDSTLPETTALYNQILDSNTRAGTYDRKYAMTALQWILGAVDDLPIDELAKAISIDTVGAFDYEVDSAMLLDLCSNLIVVDGSGCCRLAHLSVGDFLLRSGCDDPSGGFFKHEQIHCQIAVNCLSYITTIDISTDKHCISWPSRNFGSYAILFWGFHCGQARDLRTSDPLSSLFLTFLNPLTVAPAFERWTELIHDLRARGATLDVDSDSRLEVVPQAKLPLPSSNLQLSFDADQHGDHLFELDDSKEKHLYYLNITHTATRPASPVFAASMFGFLEILRLVPAADLLSLRSTTGDRCLHMSTHSADAIEFLLQIEGIDLCVANATGLTPLHIASMVGFDHNTADDILFLLLGKMTRSQICLQDLYGETALHKAARNGNHSFVRTLVSRMEGVDFALVENAGETVLYHAVRSRNISVTNMVISAMRPEDISIKNADSSTASHWCAEQGEADLLAVVLSRSRVQDLGIQDSDGNTPSHLSAMNSSVRCVELLLEKVMLGDLATQNQNNETPLHMALVGDSAEKVSIQEGRTQLLQLLRQDEERVLSLLVRGMKSEALGLQDVHGFTALSRASFSNSFTVHSNMAISALVDKMQPQDIALPDRLGRTSLHIASCKGQTSLVRIVLDYGANAEIRNRRGCSALLDTVRANTWPKQAIIEMLLAKGANVNVSDSEGYTAIHYAVLNGNGILVAILLDAGANVEATTPRGIKPLHMAVEEENGILQDLLIAGADPNCRLPSGKSVLHCAVYRAHVNNIRNLLEAGADPYTMDNLGCTSIDWASRSPILKEVMLPHCKDYTLTDPTISTAVLKQTIARTARTFKNFLANEEIIVSEADELDLTRLGRSLLLVLDPAEACTAYEVVNRKKIGWIEPVHHAICDSLSCGRSGNITGARHVCRTCPDIDFCSDCAKRYEHELLNEYCQDHKFLVVPGDGWYTLAEGKVNQAGETREEWLERLIKTYGENQ